MLLLAAATVAAAVPVSDSSAETIVVTATRSPEPLSRVGQSVTVLDSVEIRTRQTQVVADLLRTTPGVTVARNGPPGGVASVFIRGAESDQTVALIDGVKLNNPASPGGGFDFGNLLTGNIDRIEVLRGPSSVLWGSQAIGGVVNLITIPPSADLIINARAEYGGRDTAQAVANVSGTAGPLAISGGAGYYRTDGFSAFDKGAERDGYRNYGANAKVVATFSDAISLDLRGYYSNGRADFDGFAPPTFAFGDTREYGRVEEIVGYAGANIALFGGRLKNRLGFAYTDTDRDNFDPDGFTRETFSSVGRNERFEYQGVADLGVATATFGAERETSKLRTLSFGTPDRDRARIDSVYGQIGVTPVAGLTATAGIRHDDHDRFGGATTVAGSAVWTIATTTLRASYSEGFKAPTLYQLVGEYGNATLAPERARGWDAGVTQSALDGRLEASATWFDRRSRDLIDFVSCFGVASPICVGRPFGTYDNVARARSRGVEVGLAARPVDALRLGANYTYLKAENRSPGSANFGRRLARRPAHSANVTLDYVWPFGLTTGATLSHVGDSFDNAANTRRLESYVLADIRAAFPVTANIEVYGRVENALDANYATAFGYGTPGRSAHAGVRLRY
ncbi:TonB-dependent receptor plug domain-containing protein [Glacieibacterium frigidum]|uniref:TonB-dependent receptor n=1 Tax=Glacieibacterium frigidum TaxID=2593303 RepID=A0A552UJ83_9SPHN|nr:TonB-dependent receptor [Glacieibacterium frigidum]TRW18306.1 TonB-dependent receptor [Glacieibacterium frigidum]